jgi:hypothetical protein
MLDIPSFPPHSSCPEAKLLERSLADVEAAIQCDSSLPKATRDAQCCSIRRVAKFLGRDPAQLPARLEALRFGIAGLHHAQLGISRKTLQNHIANLKAAVRHVAGQKRMSGRGIALTPVWQSLYDQLTDRRLRLGLCGFMKYGSATGMDPWCVSETSVGAFISYATEVQFTVKPNDLHKQVTRCWNRARETVPGWPQITLTVPDCRPPPASLPWEAFERSFMQWAEKTESSTTFARAVAYRNGLIIALLAADPLRLANIASLEIGRTLIKDGTTWSFEIPAEQTKERRLHLALLPDWSTSCIDRYVQHSRPLFRNVQSTSRLWISRNGRPLSEHALYCLQADACRFRQEDHSASHPVLPCDQHRHPSRSANGIGNDRTAPSKF